MNMNGDFLTKAFSLIYIIITYQTVLQIKIHVYNIVITPAIDFHSTLSGSHNDIMFPTILSWVFQFTLSVNL